MSDSSAPATSGSAEHDPNGAPGAALTTADGVPLKQSLNRAIRRSRLKALLLVAPLLIFIGLAFVMPIFDMLSRSVDNPEVSTYLPRTSEALVDWDGEGLPDEATYAALADDLAAGLKARNLGRVASRLNYEMSGMRSLFMKSARKAARMEAPYKAALIEADEDWQDPDIWRLIKRESTPYTASYYLAAVDRQFSPTGEIVEKPEYLQIHVSLFIRTFWMSAAITGLCLLLAYPVAWLLATLPAGRGNLLMILVLLPFWTSLLVRTTTWIAILQQQGVLNDMLVGVGILAEEARIQMIYNKTGTIIAMTHILLPFMILPLYSVMKTIPPSYMHAARSLGAGPITAFRRVYFPQTLPGIGAGSILVFILSIGYYITPALVGGQSGRFITNFIAYHMQTSLNWGLAAAIGSILLVVVILFYLVYNRLIGVDKVKLG
ncbi:ABC transporter permease [Cobetia marina]|jgi:putative spermidine/putrescine transport system permease protein|uniref:ABC transporter permease n=1 Tax=Cobetia TaxID=204286 RepID=UPI0009856AC4|nr:MULTISPECIES: ABC transporter permease [Cobetia]POR08623.1 ABC transporter permease [Cobetia sp. MM1IDA2H-1]TKD64330.1 ABC transporter permease [Cobetia marina]GED43697.1 polyamine ABC transporter substrate-binding protein [Cobetia marina]